MNTWRSACEDKRSYPTWAAADQDRRHARRHNIVLQVYPCNCCGGFHLGHGSDSERVRRDRQRRREPAINLWALVEDYDYQHSQQWA